MFGKSKDEELQELREENQLLRGTIREKEWQIDKITREASNLKALVASLKAENEEMSEKLNQLSKDFEAVYVDWLRLKRTLEGHREAIRRYRKKLGLKVEDGDEGRPWKYSAEVEIREAKNGKKLQIYRVKYVVPDVREPELVDDALLFAHTSMVQLVAEVEKVKVSDVRLEKVAFDGKIKRFVATYRVGG